MGTNYYIGDRHVGKSSYGWQFALRIYPDEGINTLEDWLPLFFAGPIRNEYDDALSATDMLLVIMIREAARPWDTIGWAGYANESAFHEANYSERGSHGLLRARIGRHTGCVGYGPGPWSYFVGEFS